jgi:hypothetical protein
MIVPVTKTVLINRSPMAVFAFLANGENWPKFAVHNILSIRPGSEGDWVKEQFLLKCFRMLVSSKPFKSRCASPAHTSAPMI